jgi:hypothetical protein
MLISGKPIYWPFPATGTLAPGAEMVLRVTTLVDAAWSSKLTIGEEETNGMSADMMALISDVLVLQVAGGKDTVRCPKCETSHMLIPVHHPSSELPIIDSRSTPHSAQQTPQWYPGCTSRPAQASDRLYTALDAER